MAIFETTNDLFDKAIALEYAAEEFYHRLAKMFAHEQAVADFWSRLADEECKHADFLKHVRGSLSYTALTSIGNSAALEMANRSLSRSLDEILSGVFTLDDAYKIAIELEHSETNAVFNFILVNFPPPDYLRAQSFLNGQLERHVASIENDFPEKFKTSSLRREVVPLLVAS